MCHTKFVKLSSWMLQYCVEVYLFSITALSAGSVEYANYISAER